MEPRRGDGNSLNGLDVDPKIQLAKIVREQVPVHKVDRCLPIACCFT